MQHAKQYCHVPRDQRHCGHTHGPTSFWMQDPDRIFCELQLNQGDCFLDLGCGRGDYAVYASKIVGDAGQVYALDRWEQTIGDLTTRIEQQGVKNVRAITADITGALPLEEHSVDVCFLATVLHTINLKTDGKRLFREILRAVQPNGQVAIVECKKEHQTFGPPTHMRLSPEELEETITPYGFKTIHMTDLGHNYLIRFNVNTQRAA